METHAHRAAFNLTNRDLSIIQFLKLQTSWQTIQACSPLKAPAKNEPPHSEWLKKLMQATKDQRDEIERFEIIDNLQGLEIEMMEYVDSNRITYKR